MRVDADLSDDAALGGRLRLLQPRRGHRFGHDAILLAAAVAACPGERAAELGAGVGAAGLALAARVAGVSVALVEIDPALAALAAENAERNQCADRVSVYCLDVSAPEGAFAGAGLAPASFDQVLTNPPFNDPARHNASPDPGRRAAHSAQPLAPWVATSARLLRPHGTLTVIFRADGLADLLTALAPEFGATAIIPIYPRPDAPAIRIIVSATKGGRGPLSMRPGLVLNDNGRPSTAAETILREAGRLSIRDS